MKRTLKDLSDPRRSIVLDIGERTVEITFDDPVADADLHEAVRRHLLPAPLTSDPPDAAIRIGRGSLPPVFPGEPLEVFNDDELRQDAAGRWQAWSPRSAAEWNDEGGRIDVAADAHPHEAALAVAMLLHGLNGRNETLPLHSGLVAGSGGAAMVMGASGQGKSTTIGAAFLAGLRIGADDAVFIRRTATGFRIRGLPRTPLVPAEVLPPEVIGDRELDYRNRVAIDDLELATDWLDLTCLVFVGHGTADLTEVHEIGRADATRGLISSATKRFTAGTESKRLVEALGALSALPRYRLALGVEPSTRPESTGAALRSILGGDRVEPATSGRTTH